jgi:hypothetical protein
MKKAAIEINPFKNILQIKLTKNPYPSIYAAFFYINPIL